MEEMDKRKIIKDTSFPPLISNERISYNQKLGRKAGVFFFLVFTSFSGHRPAQRE